MKKGFDLGKSPRKKCKFRVSKTERVRGSDIEKIEGRRLRVGDRGSEIRVGNRGSEIEGRKSRVE